MLNLFFPGEGFSLWSDHQEVIQDVWKKKKRRYQQEDDDLDPEIKRYLSQPPGRLGDNPFAIWKEFSMGQTNLQKLAVQYLTIVGTSVPSERLFSKAKSIISSKRSQLKGERASKIVFLGSLGQSDKYWGF